MNGLNDKKGLPREPFFAPSWNLGRLILKPTHRPLIMGIINLTPDSFYDGGRLINTSDVLTQATKMIESGADALDLGAESSRPGARAITTDEECRRLLPALKTIRSQFDIPITVDTIRPDTARIALAEGANAINDINGGRADKMFEVVAEAQCGLILMHMQGTPSTMQSHPAYESVVPEVTRWLADRHLKAQAAGINSDRLMVDPGIGFGKTLEHNLALMAHLNTVSSGGPLLLGASRKSFISHLTSAEVDDRLPGSLAALSAAWFAGVSMVRVHDVGASVQYYEVLNALFTSR